ncbi:MAG: protease modulator HflC [Chloroflexi bacterium]|nr:protease modulator HflC [Chloroflexota bacterium]
MYRYRIAIALALVALLAAVAACQSTYVVKEGEQAIVLYFGRPVREVNTAGLYFKVPFAQTALAFPTQILSRDTQPGEYSTLDRGRVMVDQVIRWRIVDPLRFYTSVGNEETAAGRLESFATGHLRQEVARRPFNLVVGAQREDVRNTVTESVRNSIKDSGIDVVDVRFNIFDLSPAAQTSILASLTAEQKVIADGLRAEGREKATETQAGTEKARQVIFASGQEQAAQIRAGADKGREIILATGQERAAEIRAAADKERQIALATAIAKAQVLRGEGDALATEVMGQAHTKDAEFYSFLRRIETYEAILGARTTLVLQPDSELLRYLESPDRR